MLDWLWSFLPSIFIGGGLLASAAGLLALYNFAPGVAAFVTPVLKQLGDKIGEALDTLWNMSGKAVITIVCLMILSYTYGKHVVREEAKQQVTKELHQCFTFKPKKGWGC